MHKRNLLLLSILSLVIGFAAVATTLVMNVTVNISENTNDFDVFFSDAIENGFSNKGLIGETKKNISFETKLTLVGESYVLDYEITNNSSQYDANFTIEVNGALDSNLVVVNNYEKKPLKAKEKRMGRLTIKMLQPLVEEKNYNMEVRIVSNPIERDASNTDEPIKEYKDYLMAAEPYRSEDVYIENISDMLSVREGVYNGTTYLGHTLDRNKVEKVTFLATKEVPENVIESWDVSEKQNGSVMAYTLDDDADSLLEIYIGQDGGVMANPDSSCLFLFFTALKSIEGIENFYTADVTNMEDMFAFCKSLESLDLSTFNTSKVESFITMFSFCISLKNLDVSSFDTSSALYMPAMFNFCESLESLDVSRFNTSNVVNMYTIFQKCMKLKELDVSSFETSKVTNMEAMFSQCESLESLELYNFDTSNVPSMNAMFNNCRSLKSLNLSNFNTSNVTTVDAMFAFCRNLESLDVSSFDTSNIANMESMFEHCESLKDLNLLNFNTSKATNMKRMFAYCDNLSTEITLSNSNLSSYSSMFIGAAKYGQITVNYTASVSSKIDSIINTKSSSSNVIKGTQI